MGVVLLGTLKGILAAVILSMLSLFRMANNPPVRVLVRKRGTDVFRPRSAEHPDDESFPGLLILQDRRTRSTSATRRTSASGSGRSSAKAHPTVLLLDCGGIPGLEFTALKMLAEAEAKLRAEGVELWLAALSAEALPLVQGSPLGDAAGPGADVLHGAAGGRAVSRPPARELTAADSSRYFAFDSRSDCTARETRRATRIAR